ncbi:hypothetical protein ACFP3I_11110 [Chryseobacterium arachidis]|uniref:hypothetical protein n=1 Tax=Chryseobacterium arachidis TaxID=1416778 RepID=UPI0036198C1D
MENPIIAVREGNINIFSGCLIQDCSRNAKIATAIAAISGRITSRSAKCTAVATISRIKIKAAVYDNISCFLLRL